MGYDTAKVLRDEDDVPIPQIWDEEADAFLPYEGDARLKGSRVEEVLTQADAVSEVLTFSAPIQSIEIYHNEDTPQEFVVNGITIPVGPGGWRSPIGGTPSDEVTIPASVDCVVSRLV